MNSLVIGSSSQLAHYFPEEYERISSQNIRENLPLPLKSEVYDRVYITFAEQRLHEVKDFKTYIEVNCIKTLKLVEFFKNKANAIIVYGSCELWNNYNGEISIEDKFDYDIHSQYVGYCISKQMMVDEIHSLGLSNVFVLHPFNFNSIYRKPGFLFSKIFDSIKNKKKIEIGDTYFYRDIIHPKYVVERSIEAKSDEIVGSGRLTFMNEFIRDLYKSFSMYYEDYVSEIIIPTPKKKILFLKSKDIKYSYFDLIRDTIEDIKNGKT